MLYCFISGNNPQKISKLTITKLKDCNNLIFQDFDIYNSLIDEELISPLPTPFQFSTPFQSKIDGFFRYSDELFNIPDDIFNTFRSQFWHKTDLLLWFQREYMEKWFKGYDPMSDDSYDTPYDLDHIVPYSHLINPGTSCEIHSADDELKQKFYDNRWLYINYIGNKRLWPFWGNRSDNSSCHTIKLRMNKGDLSDDLIAKELGLQSSNDFLAASVIDLTDKELWLSAGGRSQDWPEERRSAWQQAVENRVRFLYSKFYEELGFNLWVTEKKEIVPL